MRMSQSEIDTFWDISSGHNDGKLFGDTIMARDWREEGVPFGTIAIWQGTKYVYKHGLLHYPERRDTQEWQQPVEFQATLKWLDFARGRSAAYILWESLGGLVYPMFLKDLADLIQQRSIVLGQVTGTWQYVKRGSNYGIALAQGQNQ